MISNTFGRRLKEARKVRGLSQKNLGIEAGLDEFIASTRINRYEKGVHEPDSQMVTQLAAALGIPRAYLYADDDDLAEMINLFAKLDSSVRQKLIEELRAIIQKQGNEERTENNEET